MPDIILYPLAAVGLIFTVRGLWRKLDVWLDNFGGIWLVPEGRENAMKCTCPKCESQCLCGDCNYDGNPEGGEREGCLCGECSDSIVFKCSGDDCPTEARMFLLPRKENR